MMTDPFPLLPKVMDLLVDAVCVVDVEGRFLYVNSACERIFGYLREELIGTNMIDLVYPEDRERTLRAAGEIMRGSPKTHFENRYVRKDGRVVHIMWSARWSEEDRIRMAVARDVTELRRAASVQAAVYRISEAVHLADGLPGLYREIHRIIAELLSVERFIVALRNESSGELAFPFAADRQGESPDAVSSESRRLCAEIIESGRPLLVTSDAPLPVPDAAPGVHAGQLDWLGVPLAFQDSMMGVLAVEGGAEERRFTAEDRKLLQFVSRQVATAIERKRAETQLQHMARHDALTGLPNRTVFHDRVDVALRRARRTGEHLGVLYLDLNGFKRINDTYGHEVGDLLLTEVAKRIAGCLRESDTVARMGGDEFTVLLTGIHGSACARLVADKVHVAIGLPYELGGETFSLSASIGMAVYPEQGDDRVSLFRHADDSMYQAKGMRRA
ncbi:MAG TPA: diguanylate cyclase [Gammaproteobacteria bacterium]|nr:diguanylate cyclase [Gammaproteobacteria bacterium]